MVITEEKTLMSQAMIFLKTLVHSQPVGWEAIIIAHNQMFSTEYLQIMFISPTIK